MASSTSIAQTQDGFQGTFMVADQIDFDRATETMQARGHVEVFHDGMTLRAPSVVYNGQADQVSVMGPITLHDAASGSTTFADFAELSADLQNFILIAARHVMQDQLQIAATEMERRDGRFTEWRTVTASYCEVCPERPTPLWEIRARRATHDQVERMIYLRHAQFRVAGVPLAYTPYLRMPDPSVDRATGFVSASIRSSTLTGTTLRLPYFIVLNDQSDLTLTPGFSLGGSVDTLNTLEARYRRAFSYGDLEINGAVSRDDLTAADTRAYMFMNGDFTFPSGVDLSFQVQTASDRTYLSTYNFFNGSTETFTGRELSFNSSTLVSNLNINRSRPDEILQFNALWLDTLQAPTTTTDHPSRLIASEYARWFTIDGLPGSFLFSTVGQSEYNEYGPNNARQRDISRVFTGLSWNESWDLPGRFVLDTELAGFGDIYSIKDDAAFAGDQTTTNALGVIALRWPWERTMPGGIRHTVEPFVRHILFEGDPISVPAVDGTIDDFDPNGRFNLGRFRRIDRNRDLTSTEVGVDYMAYFPSGWYTGGRVEQDYLWNTGPGTYNGGILYTTNLGYRANGVSFDSSSSFNSDLFAVADRVSLSYSWDHGTIGTSYRRIGVDPALSTTSKTNLLTANLAVDVTDTIAVYSNLTRDTETNDTSFVSGGLDFDNAQDWSSSLSANYSIDDAEFDRQGFSLSHDMDWGGDVNFFYDFDREAERSVGIELDYINECVNLQSQIVRRQSVIDNSEAALELSISVEIGGFAHEGGRRCG